MNARSHSYEIQPIITVLCVAVGIFHCNILQLIIQQRPIVEFFLAMKCELLQHAIPLTNSIGWNFSVVSTQVGSS